MKSTIVVLLCIAIVTAGGSGEDTDGRHTEMDDMQLIKGGTFQMGDVFDEGVRFATPVHKVTISSFYLNKFEVTVEEFSAFVDDCKYATSAEKPNKFEAPTGEGQSSSVGEKYNRQLATCGAHLLGPPSNGSWGEDASWKNPDFEQSSKDPVTCVSWRDAVCYCNWLSKKEGLPAAYDVESGNLLDAKGNPTTDVTKAKGYRLPTEAEWEFAAREGGKKIRFGNGSNVARSSEMNINASGAPSPYSEKGEFRKKTVPVGSFKPNSLSLCDMSGNVWEWCSDFLCEYTSDPGTDPYQIEKLIFGPRHAARGGPWVGDADSARVAARFGWVAEDRCNNIGFRLAKSE